jgi:hypothetical protein
MPSRRETDQVSRAADYCIDVVASGPLAAIEVHATEYISEKTWDRIRKTWKPRHCDRLAQYARNVLDGRQSIHRLIGRSIGRIAGALGAAPSVQIITEEICSRVPLPVLDHEAVIVSRALQVTGVFMCVWHDRPLTDCVCFIDVVIAEGKEKMKQLLLLGAHDWEHLYLAVPVHPVTQNLGGRPAG